MWHFDEGCLYVIGCIHFLDVRNSPRNKIIYQTVQEKNEFRNFMHSILNDEGKLARKQNYAG